MKKTFMFLSVLVIVFGFWAIAMAIPMAGPTGPPTFQYVDGVVGESFTVAQTVWVTSLGIADCGTELGLQGSHPVGIFDQAGNLLVQETISSGSTYRDGYYWEELDSPFVLSSGITFVLGAYYGGSGTRDSFGTVAAIDPLFTLLGARQQAWTGGLLFPTQQNLNQVGWFGPNMEYEIPANAVPEPATMLLLGIGLVGLIATRKKRVLVH